MYDLVIKNGFIVDGTGSKGFKGDIAVNGDKICAIAEKIDENAKEVIDASNLVVAPGFLDNHSHGDLTAALEPSGYNALEQGITTQITGHCGTAVVPFGEESMKMHRGMVSDSKWEFIKKVCFDFKSFIEYIDTLSMGTNLACYIAHGAVRERVMGFKDDLPTKEEIDEMLLLIRQGMELGYLGFATGLDYTPSVYAKEDEIISIARVASEYGGGYTSHIRNEGDLVEESIKEAINVGRVTGVPVTISHLKVEGQKNWGQAEKLLKLIDNANNEGVKVMADQYPYSAGSAPLISQIPPRFLTKGNSFLLEEIKNRSVREAIDKAIFNDAGEFESAIYCSGYEGTTIAYAENQNQYIGRSLKKIAREENKQPIDALCDILINSRGNVQGIYFSQSDEDVMKIMRHPRVMCGTDWLDLFTEGGEDDIGGIHPRAMGSVPRRISMLRDDGGLSLEHIIRNLTELPAQTSSLDGIGVLKEGFQADICIFDYNSIGDRADYLHPYRKNKGIAYVLVRGKVAVKDGIVTGCRNGKLLRRKNTQKTY
jgi:N-acyl-D-amino-acid deacylase